ncbi:imidazoleglycerol-phosphate dehydratase HisB [Ignavibacteria bacterium 4148-Me]|uniref:imidazoleglycerol-phosphate dehydratase HisB n=1 Tax=Rosettibacter primus TaxID=3111523 RepID=UPI00336C1ABF
MKNILIDSELFNPSNKLAKGLISSLKKLSEYSFQIFADKDKIDRTVLDILKLEGIKINPAKKNSDYLEIRIKGKSSDNKIVISKNKIKNIEEAVDRIIKNLRSAEIKRKTKETDITIKLELDGEGKAEIETGIGFFNHMIEQIARHANLNLTVEVKGDLNIDEHHTIEDTGIALGEALRKALGDKKGIKRFGFMLPMDDSVAVCAIDLSGRNFLNFNCKFQREKVGEFPTELTEEFFRGLTIGLMANIYIKAEGKNDHHKIESIFKAFAKALNEACRIDPRAKGLLPSTKGKL